MATNTPQRAFGGLLAASVADILTVPNDGSVSRYAITQIIIANVDASADHAVTIYQVENGGTTGDDRKMVPTSTVKTNGFIILNGIFDFEPGDKLRGFADVANKVNVLIHYIKVSP